MILREMIPESLQFMAPPVQGVVPAAAEKENGGTRAFGDILNSTVKSREKSDAAPGKSTKQVNTKTAAETPAERPAMKTFRDIQNEIRREAVKSKTQAKGEIAFGPQADDKGAVRETVDEVGDVMLDKVVNCFAQALGLNPGELRQLLEAADAAPEELISLADVKQLTVKIAEVLGLNAEQTDTLNSVFELVKTQVQSAAGVKDTAAIPSPEAVDIMPDDTAIAKLTKDPPEIEIVRVQNRPDTDYSALKAKIKQSLHELQGRLNGDGGLADEIALKVNAILNNEAPPPEFNAEIKTTANDNSVASIQDGGELPAADKAVVKTDEKGFADGKEGKSDDNTDDNVAKPALETVVSAESDEQPQTVFPIAAQVNKPGETGRVGGPELRTPVQAREIIGQVLEKAKVILTGDKSEMVMDLKPDSLGKLSLKVVTEHGMIMAKFVTENQQVKQVIETNMQLLKDSLEKQGMSVQGFSVSVREDSRQAYGRQTDNGSSKRAVYRSGAFDTERQAISAERLEAIESRNPYNWSTSTVNYTA